jgi:hypothetical protein
VRCTPSSGDGSGCVALGNEPDRLESASEPDSSEPEIPEGDVEWFQRTGYPPGWFRQASEPEIPEGEVEMALKEELPLREQLPRRRKRD